MKLSEAILAGSTGIRAIAGTRYGFKEGSPHGCALGMAEFSIGLFGHPVGAEGNWEWLNQSYTAEFFPCHCCPTLRGSTYSTVIAQTFNNHVMGRKDWTLEQLVDYVRSIEPAEETDPELAEQYRAEEEAAAEEGALIEASGYADPASDPRFA